MQADRATGGTRQFDVYQGAGPYRELEPFLLEAICDELLRTARNRLRLEPVQVGRGDRAAIGKLRGSVRASGSRSDAMRFSRTSAKRLVEDRNAIAVGSHIERTQIGLAFAKPAWVTSRVVKNLDRVALIGLRDQRASYAGGTAIGGRHAQDRVILVVVRSGNCASMVESDAVAAQVDAQVRVVMDTVALDADSHYAIIDQDASPKAIIDDQTTHTAAVRTIPKV